jgi:hypothetical protein
LEAAGRGLYGADGLTADEREARVRLGWERADDGDGDGDGVDLRAEAG